MSEETSKDHDPHLYLSSVLKPYTQSDGIKPETKQAIRGTPELRKELLEGLFHALDETDPATGTPLRENRKLVNMHYQMVGATIGSEVGPQGMDEVFDYASKAPTDNLRELVLRGFVSASSMRQLVGYGNIIDLSKLPPNIKNSFDTYIEDRFKRLQSAYQKMQNK